MTERIPPHSEQLERAVLGAALADETTDRVLYLCAEYGITAEGFYLRPHQLIFQTMQKMQDSGQHCDLLTLSKHLSETGVIELVGGAMHLADMVVEAGAGVEAYIAELRSLMQRRQMIQMGREVVDLGYGLEGEDTSMALADAQARILSLDGTRSQRTASEVVESVSKTWSLAHEGSPVGLECPWKDLQKLWGGPQPGLVTMIAARKGTGKSTMIGQWAKYLADKGIPVGICPFEDGPERLYGRFAAMHGKFSDFEASYGRFRTQEQLNHALDSLQRVKTLPIHFVDGRRSLSELTAWAVQAVARHKIRVLFVDAFKDILTPGKTNEDDIALSAGLQAIADRLRIPLVVTAHVRKTDNPLLKLNDIRGSSRLGDDAKLILAIQQEGDIYAFDVLENNFGPCGAVQVERRSNPSLFVEKTEWEEREEGWI